MTRRDRIEIVPVSNMRSQRGKCFLRLRASNGRILAVSEVYANKANAKRAVQSWADAFADINGGHRIAWPAVEVDQ